ncbi:DEAD/DEAH box helicase family protein [Legionella bononiensis]|uniref:DEAD/DEAH box helicase family protein n=1 Tax=Legionella bononiensis TaxID=2793102 RepID=A0ABS1WAD6_9GAMM|nr:DEAD/DEAH box helicase family protein [Legionella bononiensis]MBL7480462.1 DEAD/DEAH box helicase family protein [Legionella bononiensis]MBL7526303.1 DEAD/DEAH box helicase family protein [Legionella bononiensis]MBL7563202.1 DEAD/DEAH box helicase family protein [Legionella bononiensis]
MKLRSTDKNKLLSSANEVYLAYAALDFFKSRTFKTDSGTKSVYELCQQAIKEQQFEQIVVLNGVNYKLELKPKKDNTFKVQFSKPLATKSAPVVKKINSYLDQDVLNLLSSQQFILQIPKNSDEPVVSNKINNRMVIGGIGKIELYRTHLVTLHNIIEKIDSEEDISNLLVALATGTGKTYVQALWMLVLTLSENNGVFAVPDRLAHQFSKDLKRLLPDSFVDSMFVLREQENNPAAEEALKSLKNKDTSGTIIIGSSEYLLDKHYHDLENADSEHTFLAFDEQHLIMKAERRRIRLIELSQKKLSMFLTATPNQETYKLSGNKPVAIMSSGQKMEAGQGQFPKLVSFQARNITDRNKLKTYQFWTAEFWSNMFNGLLLRLTNAIQEEQSSAAVSLVDDLLYYHFDKEDESSARWRMQVPVARKMLCIIDDNETLVNFCNSLQNSDNYSRDVYRNGNLVDRSDVANFFHLPDAEVSVIQNDLDDKRRAYDASLKPDERQVSILQGQPTLAKQIKNTIFHNLIEYVLTDITGLDEIEHNRLRKLNMNDFQRLVIERFQPRTAMYYQQKLAKEIDADGARVIGALLAELSTVLQLMINGQFDSRLSENNKDLTHFIDNWSLYNHLIDKIKRNRRDLNRSFDDYAEKHLMMGVMQGMKDAETPIAESKPFAGLQRHVHRLYDSNGVLEKNAKKRKHTSLEILNDTSTESVFDPSYLNISEEVADNYFRLGFVGIYVSNKKTEGFSDRNLHTVINIAEETLSTTNSPDTQIQGIGRNRGLDSTVVPAYIHSLGRGQKTVFNLNNLQKNDYYPELFKAQKEYNNQYIQVLGNKVSQQIIDWVYANLDEDETINPDRLKRQVLKFIAHALRDINNKNSHQIKLSRSQLTDVVDYAMKGLDKEIAHIKKPYRLSFFLRVLSHTLNFIAETYYTVIRIPVAFQIFYYSWFGNRTPQADKKDPKHPDDVYIKILNRTSFKSIIGNMSTALEFKNWMGKKTQGITKHINKNIVNYLNEEVIGTYTMYQKQLLEPLLINMVIDSKKTKVANALSACPQSLNFLHAHLPFLDSLGADNSEHLESSLLTFLQQIPGLGDLQSSDIVHYPKKMEQLVSLFNNTPAAILAADSKLQTSFTNHLALFLQNDLAKYLSAFLTYPDVRAVTELFSQSKNSRAFAKHLMTDFIQKGVELSPDLVLSEFTTFFKKPEIRFVDEIIETLQIKIGTLQNQIQGNLFQSLKVEVVDQLTAIVGKQLLPLLVNNYPLEYREELLAEASNEANIKKFLSEHYQELMALDTHNISQLAHTIFSGLIDGPLPTAINLDVEIKNATDLVVRKFEEIGTKKVRNLVVGKIMAPSSWSFNAKYLFDRPIADILQSDEFLNAISLLLPFDQWQKLKSDMQQNYPALIQVARELIDIQAEGKQAISSPEVILKLLNKHLKRQYQSSEQAAQLAIDQFKEVSSKLADNPLQNISPELQEQFVAIGYSHLLPLMAQFIKADAKKEQFLALKPESEKLFELMIQNFANLDGLMTGSDSEINLKVLNLINQLVPESDKLVEADIQNPVLHAQTSAEQLKKDMVKISLRSLLKSELFLDLLKNSFNPQDYESLMATLGTEEGINALAVKIVPYGIESLNKETLVACIKSINPGLVQIETLDVRLNNFQKFITEVVDNIGSNLNKNKTSLLLMDTMAPILFHPKFIKVIDNITGFLNEQDLTVIFNAFGRENPDQEAKQFQRFISLIRNQNKSKLIKEFMSMPMDSKEFDFDQLPAKKMLDTVSSLIEEVLDCHCYYNDQDRKGSVGMGERPKLLSKISDQLAGMRISSNYSFFSGFARKGFYIHGITQGLSAGGEVSADSNKHIANILQRVKSHILRPIWWSTNVSQLTHGFIKGCRDLLQSMKSAWYSTVNGVKSALNWVTNSHYFKLTSRNPDSSDFNDTAFDFSKRVNMLDPLATDHVKEKDCPVDVVTHMEDFVAKRPARPGFFGGNLGTQVSVPEERKSPRPGSD